jgi:hypothetical protein
MPRLDNCIFVLKLVLHDPKPLELYYSVEIG